MMMAAINTGPVAPATETEPQRGAMPSSAQAMRYRSETSPESTGNTPEAHLPASPRCKTTYIDHTNYAGESLAAHIKQRAIDGYIAISDAVADKRMDDAADTLEALQNAIRIWRRALSHDPEAAVQKPLAAALTSIHDKAFSAFVRATVDSSAMPLLQYGQSVLGARYQPPQRIAGAGPVDARCAAAGADARAFNLLLRDVIHHNAQPGQNVSRSPVLRALQYHVCRNLFPERLDRARRIDAIASWRINELRDFLNVWSTSLNTDAWPGSSRTNHSTPHPLEASCVFDVEPVDDARKTRQRTQVDRLLLALGRADTDANQPVADLVDALREINVEARLASPVEWSRNLRQPLKDGLERNGWNASPDTAIVYGLLTIALNPYDETTTTLGKAPTVTFGDDVVRTFLWAGVLTPVGKPGSTEFKALREADYAFGRDILGKGGRLDIDKLTRQLRDVCADSGRVGRTVMLERAKLFVQVWVGQNPGITDLQGQPVSLDTLEPVLRATAFAGQSEATSG